MASRHIDGEVLVILGNSLGAVSNSRKIELLAAMLEHLLHLASDRLERAMALSQVRNIARLAEEVGEQHPVTVARIFPVAEKLFKTNGNLHLALNTARVCLRACQRPPSPEVAVTNEQLHNRAQTLVCGESWVLQRIGRLDEADGLLKESLELGQALGWGRNTAFVLKCRGRLLRLRAEQLSAGEERSGLLEESESVLHQAIGAFSSSSDFGVSHPEEETAGASSPGHSS